MRLGLLILLGFVCFGVVVAFFFLWVKYCSDKFLKKWEEKQRASPPPYLEDEDDETEE